MTCSSWPGSAMTGGNPEANCVVRVMSSPISRRISLLISVMQVFKSSGLDWSIDLRLNARS